MAYKLSLYFSFGHLRSLKYSEKSEKYYRLGFMYSEQVFAVTIPFRFISVIETTALLKLEITVSLSSFHCQFIQGH